MEITGEKAKREIFIWRHTHEDCLLREVLVVEPYQFRAESKERDAAWTTMANKLTELGMKGRKRKIRQDLKRVQAKRLMRRTS